MEKKLKEEAEKKKVEQLKVMGFPEEWAKDALKETKVANWADPAHDSAPIPHWSRSCRVVVRAVLTHMCVWRLGRS
jgi:hypothetical protein